MARKKREESSGGNAPWLNTFADLMNLLLCFFVMIFAFSSVDGEKFEQVSISLANSFGVLEGGGSAIGQGQLISSGMTQLSQLDTYYTTMGKSKNKSGDDADGESDSEDISNTDEGNQGNESSGSMGNKGKDIAEGTEDQGLNEGSTGSDDSKGGTSTGDNAGSSQDVGLDEAIAKIEEEKAAANADMYDQVSDLADQYNLNDYVELNMDSNNKYVQLTLKGSVLYDSGKADIKDVAKPILSKIGDILKNFEGFSVEITGHTDNVPMTSSTFKDNNWLSSARALNAAEYLIDKCGIDPAHLKYSGRGEYEPISSNATPEGRAMNRRIEIKIYNEYSGG